MTNAFIQLPATIDKVSVIIDGNALLAAGFNVQKPSAMSEFHQVLLTKVFEVVGPSCSLDPSTTGGHQHHSDPSQASPHSFNNSQNQNSISLNLSSSAAAMPTSNRGGFTPDIFCFFSSSFLSKYHVLSKMGGGGGSSTPRGSTASGRPTNNYSIIDACRRFNYQCTIVDDTPLEQRADSPSGHRVDQLYGFTASPSIAAAMATRATGEKLRMFQELLRLQHNEIENRRGNKIGNERHMNLVTQRSHHIIFVGGIEERQHQQQQTPSSSAARPNPVLKALALTEYELTSEPLNLLSSVSSPANDDYQKQYTTNVDFIGIGDDESAVIEAAPHQRNLGTVNESEGSASVSLAAVLPSIPSSNRPQFLSFRFVRVDQNTSTSHQGGSMSAAHDVSISSTPEISSGYKATPVLNEGRNELQTAKATSQSGDTNIPATTTTMANGAAAAATNGGSFKASHVSNPKSSDKGSNAIADIMDDLFGDQKVVAATHPPLQSQQQNTSTLVANVGGHDLTSSRRPQNTTGGSQPIDEESSRPNYRQQPTKVELALESARGELHRRLYNFYVQYFEPSAGAQQSQLCPESEIHLKVFAGKRTTSADIPLETISTITASLHAAPTPTTTLPWPEPLYVTLMHSSPTSKSTSSTEIYFDGATYKRHYFVETSNVAKTTSTSWTHPLGSFFTKFLEAQSHSPYQNTIAGRMREKILFGDSEAPAGTLSATDCERIVIESALSLLPPREAEANVPKSANPPSLKTIPTTAVSTRAVDSDLEVQASTRSIATNNRPSDSAVEELMAALAAQKKATEEKERQLEAALKQAAQQQQRQSLFQQQRQEPTAGIVNNQQAASLSSNPNKLLDELFDDNNNFGNSTQHDQSATGVSSLIVGSSSTSRGKFSAEALPHNYQQLRQEQGSNPDQAPLSQHYSYTGSSRGHGIQNANVEDLMVKHTPKPAAWVPPPQITNPPASQMAKPFVPAPAPATSTIPNIVMPSTSTGAPITPTTIANPIAAVEPPTPRRNIPNLVIGGVRMPTAASEIKSQQPASPVAQVQVPYSSTLSGAHQYQPPQQQQQLVPQQTQSTMNAPNPQRNPAVMGTPRGTPAVPTTPTAASTPSSASNRLQHPSMEQFINSNKVKNSVWGPQATTAGGGGGGAAPSPLSTPSTPGNSLTNNGQFGGKMPNQTPTAPNPLMDSSSATTYSPTETDVEKVRASLPKGWDCQLFVKEGRPNRIVYIDHATKTTSWERPK